MSLVPSAQSMDQIQTEEKHEETLVEAIANDSNSDNDDIDFADDYTNFLFQSYEI